MNKYKAEIVAGTDPEVELFEELRCKNGEVLGHEILYSWPRDEALEIYLALHRVFDEVEVP